ncbi:MYPU_1760 family metalloprotease [Mycoplasmopsis verecunda]|uniref:Uncharacterized protein n=1 Tax=Mycoplasmopsis verecunda TaxID=171291 RepID=A0A1T4LX23_9BACT|nr:hypothetical protein [Mycoplasmopsis verecunda]WPB54572.1 hypothetical protein SAM46_00160 [Mycoplasmopsis verecunda]SJZ59038.1 hypothetical protein SAMN02745154_00560 [Mycoplasmopsis verecunda]
MKKSTRNWLYALIGTVTVLASASVVAGTYFAINSLFNKDNNSTDNGTIKINPDFTPPKWQTSINKNHWINLSEREMLLSPDLNEDNKTKALQAINQVGELDNTQYQNSQGTYVKYVDPYTKVEYKDYAYYIDNENPENNRYLLGTVGLAYLAQEFKRKVPFGPEIFDLEGINVNDFKIIPQTANGLYIPSVKNIYINAAFLCETDASIYDIIATIMQTLFHEYMHHWANNYAEIASKSDNIINPKENWKQSDINAKQVAYIRYYQPSSTDEYGDNYHNHGAQQYWNGYFASKFRTLLNYDVQAKSYIKPEILQLLRARYYPVYSDEYLDVSDALYYNYSPADLWNVSNNTRLSPSLNRLWNNAPDSVWFSPSEKFSLNKGDLRYYYSLTELVPREYLKYGFESYYNINEPNPARIAINNKKDFSSGFFGDMKFRYKNAVLLTTEIRPSSIADDYGKVFMNNFDSLDRSGWYITENNGPEISSPDFPFGKPTMITGNSIMIPATPFALPSYQTQSNNLTKSQYQNIITNKSNDFYNLFLDTMGYGKTISQIYYDNEGWQWKNTKFDSVSKDDENAMKISLSGYLDNKDYTGFVFLNDNGNVIAKTNIQYLDVFNFFGHKDFDKGARLYSLDNQVNTERQAQLDNRIYPNDFNVAYKTDYVNVQGASLIYLWSDLNNDGLVQENEINKEKEITLPTQRWVTTYRAENPINWYKVYKDGDKTRIQWNDKKLNGII